MNSGHNVKDLHPSHMQNIEGPHEDDTSNKLPPKNLSQIEQASFFKKMHNASQIDLSIKNTQAYSLGKDQVTGNPIKREAYQNTPKLDLKAKVFFKCLPRSITKEEVYLQFSKFGHILQIRLPYSKKKQKFIGYGYVLYGDEKTAHYLINVIKSLTICGKQISLQRFTEVDSLSWHDLKRIDLIIDDYAKYEQNILGDSNKNSEETSDEVNLPKPIIELAERPYARSVFYTRWNLQSIKPIHSHYYTVRHLIKEFIKTEATSPNNLQFRIRS